mgnify:CR=1 FL=1
MMQWGIKFSSKKVSKSESVKSELLANQLIFIADDYHNVLARAGKWYVLLMAHAEAGTPDGCVPELQV